MPGSGKSTVGVILAKQCCKAFLDTDVLIQIRTGRTLQDIVDREGYLRLRELEEQVLLDLRTKDCVIATGGSAVYSDRAMTHLKADGMVVFLDADLPTLRSRVPDFGTRGLAKRPDQTFEELFEERRPLYQRYADETIVCAGLAHEAVAMRVRERACLVRRGGPCPGENS